MIKIEHTNVYGFEAAIRGYPEYKVTKDGRVIGKRGKPMKGHDNVNTLTERQYMY